MSRNEYSLGLISKVRDQAHALSDRPIPWPKDSVDYLYKALQACTLATRLDINNLLPVNRLPHEVLSQIFELACSPPSAATMAFRAALTHVCRYWRGVLLSYPKIWTNIFARRDNSDFFSECLLRSRALPIRLNFHYHMGWDSPSGCSCERPSALISRRVRCPHIRARKTAELFGGYGPRERLRSLDLLIFFSDLITTGFDELEHVGFFNRPLPELETLRLVCLDAAQSSEGFIIYDSIFSGSLPNLKHLSLVHCWGGLTDWVVGLTSFHLEFRHSWDIQSAEFIAFLAHNRGTLEVLSLDNVGLDDADAEPVTLTNLRELKLKRIADPCSLLPHLILPALESLTTLHVRFSNGMATFSATNDSGAVLQVIESREDLFSCCTNGLASYRWTQISTLDLDLHDSQGVSGPDIDEIYRCIPSLEAMEIRTVSYLREIFLPLLPTKQALHPSLKLLRLPVPREVRDDIFTVLTNVTYGRKAMGCAVWDVECICDENCEEVSDQWAIHCEKNSFGSPGIAKFTTNPEFLDRRWKASESRPARTPSTPEANISKDPSREARERVLVDRENLSSQVKELIKLRYYYNREDLSRITEHVENMRIGIGRIQNEMSPIHKLPRDLLQAVLYHACWSNEHKASCFAVTLSHVCSRWRTILLSTPQFWCDVTVDGRDPSFPATCLARSGDLPLDVTIQFNYSTPPHDPHVDFSSSILEDEDMRWRSDECREGLTLLEAERDRIHRLCVNYILLGASYFQHGIMEHDFFTSNLKNLQEMRWNYDDKQGIWSLPYQTFGGSLESLRHIRLENVEPSTKRFPNLMSLECIRAYDTDCVPFMRGRMPRFFSRNASLRSLNILEFHIYDGDFTRISMGNLTSLTLSRVFRWYLLFNLLHIKNLDGGTFTTISFSNQGTWIAFSAVNSIGFSLKASISPFDDLGENDFMRRYFSGVTSIRVEDFQEIHSTERLFSILRIFGDSEGDMGRLELYAETRSLSLYPQATIFAKPFLPRLRTLAVYFHGPDAGRPWMWVRVMVEDLFNPKHCAKFPDECMVKVYCSDYGVLLSANMGELKAEFEDRRSCDYLVPRLQR